MGRAEPANINVESTKKSPERIFLEALRQKVYEQCRPAFQEVMEILAEHDYHRPELVGIGLANETNRFLNWLRLTYVIGDEAWQTAPLRGAAARRDDIVRLGREWVAADNSRIPGSYLDWLRNVVRVFGSAESIAQASQEELTDGLMSLHAFTEQSRFVKGGAQNLAAEFWKRNCNDVVRVKASLSYLLHGGGDFIQRLHDVIYSPTLKLDLFGQFCALEFYGTVRPSEFPPINGRMAKALRYLGFDVMTRPPGSGPR